MVVDTEDNDLVCGRWSSKKEANFQVNHLEAAYKNGEDWMEYTFVV